MPDGLRLQLALELVEEAPVGAFGDELAGARLDHADLLEPQRVETERVLRVELAPSVVGDLGQRLERVIVSLREPAIDQLLCDPFRLGGAEVGGLEDGPQVALGGDRMRANELAVAERCAAEILRPRMIRGGPQDDAADLAGAQLIRLGRKAEERIDLPFGEQLYRAAF